MLWAIYLMLNIFDLSGGSGRQGLGDIACDNSNMHLDEESLTNVQIKIKIFKAICMKISCFYICMQARH